MPRMNIGIVGAGGIGSYYAGLLSRAGQSVRLIARGDHLAAINARGLEVRVNGGENFVAKLEATSDESRLLGCDYVLLAVKSYSLGEVAPGLAAAAKSGASIVPLLNGIDVADRLVVLGVPRESIIGGFIRASLVRSAPGLVERKSTFDIAVLGELDGVKRDRTPALVKALADAGTTARESDNITYDLWRKFAFIVPMGVVCGLPRTAMGPVLASERGRAMITDTVAEVVSVSGGVLTDADTTAVRDELYAIQAHIKPSFLLDLEQGGKTELDLLAGTVARRGRELGVKTPIHDVAVTAFEIATQRA